MGIAAYKRTITNTEAPRQIERRVLLQITSDLERDQARFDAAERNSERLQILAEGLRQSLWQNDRLWIAFKSDLAEQSNGLNNELRASLISLAFWVERHTQKLLAGEGQMKPLIDVNRSIIRGLGGDNGE